MRMATTCIATESGHNTCADPMRETLLSCGIIASVLYVATTLLVALLWDGYSARAQTISELSAIESATGPLWMLLGTVYTVLMIAFGWIVWQTASDNRTLRVVAALVMAQAVFAFFWPPMHRRADLAAGASMGDTLHVAWAVATGVLFIVQTGFGAAALGRRFRLFSTATLVVVLASGVLTGIYALRIETALAAAYVGVWERITAAVYMLWVTVLAATLLRAPTEAAGADPRAIPRAA